MRFADVDRDGDLDIVANNEEWWADGGSPTPFWQSHPGAVQAVVWFENRLTEEPYTWGASSPPSTGSASAAGCRRSGEWSSAVPPLTRCGSASTIAPWAAVPSGG